MRGTDGVRRDGDVSVTTIGIGIGIVVMWEIMCRLR